MQRSTGSESDRKVTVPGAFATIVQTTVVPPALSA